MRLPLPRTMPAPAPVFTSRRVTIVGFVALLHVALIYALVTGLAMRVVEFVPTILTAEVLPPQQIVKPPPPVATPQLTQPAMPTVPVPVIKIAPVHRARTAITVVQGPPRPAAVAPLAPPQPPKPVIAPTTASAIGATHTIPPYPELSRRLGEQGQVLLRIDVEANGAVGTVTVNRSSGSPRLDEAAVNWVRDHWRYRPATRAGQPVASTVEAAIVFDLRSAS